jgi:hypothetical protein
MKNKLIITLLAILSISEAALAQADSYYPFNVVCPDLPVYAGSTATITAKFPPQAKLDDYTFNWKVTAGEIIEGQGTLSIKLKLPPEDIDSVTTIVELVAPYSMYTGTQKTGSCTVEIVRAPKPKLYREFDPVNIEYLAHILDGFFRELRNDPTAQGYIVIRPKTVRDAVRLERMIQNQIRSVKFDASRITTLRGERNPTNKLEAWVVPPGAELPKAASMLIPKEFPANQLTVYYG